MAALTSLLPQACVSDQHERLRTMLATTPGLTAVIESGLDALIAMDPEGRVLGLNAADAGGPVHRPLELELTEGERFGDRIEATAYFTVAEA